MRLSALWGRCVSGCRITHIHILGIIRLLFLVGSQSPRLVFVLSSCVNKHLKFQINFSINDVRALQTSHQIFLYVLDKCPFIFGVCKVLFGLLWKIFFTSRCFGHLAIERKIVPFIWNFRLYQLTWT